MYSLFNVRFNWKVLLGVALLIKVIFPDISNLSFIAVIITLHQFLLLFYSIGYIIPVRYLFGAFICMQFLLGPVLAYSVTMLNYQMVISEGDYFGYAIPAMICFILGLHIYSGKLQGEVLNEEAITEYLKDKKSLPYILIATGFLCSLISGMFSSELAFVFYLLSGLKYIGIFFIIFSPIKFKIIPLVIVYGSLLISSINQTIFHDLLIWLIFLGVVYAIKHKPSIYKKSIFVFSFIFLTVIIQVLKKDYREITRQGQINTGIGTLSTVYEQNQSSGNLLSPITLAKNSIRINQGSLVTYTMRTVPNIVPFANGDELLQILEAAILPRILAPDKLQAGDRTIFNKYTGLSLAVNGNTTMALGSLGDAYINFGVFGGCIFMFFLGALYNLVLKRFYTAGKNYPVLLLFTPLVFYFPIRPDCELQTILGHLIKSCFLIMVIFSIWKWYFYKRSINAQQRLEPVTS